MSFAWIRSGCFGREEAKPDGKPQRRARPNAMAEVYFEGYEMKVMIRKAANGKLSAYVPKKDLEEPIVAQQRTELWGGQITLANGWVLELPSMAADTGLPITVEARRVGGE